MKSWSPNTSRVGAAIPPSSSAVQPLRLPPAFQALAANRPKESGSGARRARVRDAAGFIDPLYSFGLGNTFQVVYSLVSRILEALEDDDFSVERFEYVDRVEHGLLYYQDLIVNSSFISFSEFELWNAVFRVWGAFLAHGSLRLVRARLGYLVGGDKRHFK